MDKVRLAVIGLGGRGYGMLRDIFVHFEEVEFTAVCDLYPDRVERASNVVFEKRGYRPFETDDYKAVLSRDDVDAVYIATAWETHIEIAIAAMKAGKITSIEVGGAYSIDECFDLVHTYETTKTPFMFMENCCYGKEELMTTALVRDGRLGTVVHCHGAYAHDLRSEISNGNIKRHYRLRNYLNRNCENYPTHELGPIAKLLNINRGNRMLSLVSVASKSAGIEEYIEAHPELKEKDPTLNGVDFKQGDVVNTIITCAGGETITLRLDTSLPRFYSREFTVRGTKGLYDPHHNMYYFDGMKEFDATEYHGNARDFEAEYLPKIWQKVTPDDLKYGHGGIDGLLFAAFIDAIRTGSPMPIDVYDAASWMCISALSEESISKGGAPVAIPDFTGGKWLIRKPEDITDLSKN